jgi:hypothetical protein
MTALLNRAIDELKQLPADEQDHVAREIIAMLASDRRWESLFADPRSKSALARLAAEAHAEIERGEVFDHDPATRPKT